MKGSWYFGSGLGLGMIIVACASTNPFPYTHFGMDTQTQTLLADTSSGAKDEPLSICNSSPENAAPCIVFFDAEYEQLKKDFINMSQAYSDLQKKCPQ